MSLIENFPGRSTLGHGEFSCLWETLAGGVRSCNESGGAPRRSLRRHAFVADDIHLFMHCFFIPEASVCFNLGSINTHVIIKITAINETIKGEHRLQNNSLGEKRRKKSRCALRAQGQNGMGGGDDSRETSKLALRQSNSRETWATREPVPSKAREGEGGRGRGGKTM